MTYFNSEKWKNSLLVKKKNFIGSAISSQSVFATTTVHVCWMLIHTVNVWLTFFTKDSRSNNI